MRFKVYVSLLYFDRYLNQQFLTEKKFLLWVISACQGGFHSGGKFKSESGSGNLLRASD